MCVCVKDHFSWNINSGNPYCRPLYIPEGRKMRWKARLYVKVGDPWHWRKKQQWKKPNPVETTWHSWLKNSWKYKTSFQVVTFSSLTTKKRWQWRRTPHSPKLQYYWSLTTSLFIDINRTFIVGVRECIFIIVSPKLSCAITFTLGLIPLEKAWTLLTLPATGSILPLLFFYSLNRFV